MHTYGTLTLANLPRMLVPRGVHGGWSLSILQNYWFGRAGVGDHRSGRSLWRSGWQPQTWNELSMIERMLASFSNLEGCALRYIGG
jgi:hypothetical protein